MRGSSQFKELRNKKGSKLVQTILKISKIMWPKSVIRFKNNGFL